MYLTCIDELQSLAESWILKSNVNNLLWHAVEFSLTFNKVIKFVSTHKYNMIKLIPVLLSYKESYKSTISKYCWLSFKLCQFFFVVFVFFVVLFEATVFWASTFFVIPGALVLLVILGFKVVCLVVVLGFKVVVLFVVVGIVVGGGDVVGIGGANQRGAETSNQWQQPAGFWITRYKWP